MLALLAVTPKPASQAEEARRVDVSLAKPNTLLHGLEIHYSPVENLEILDVALLEQAKNTIDIAAYVLTDVPVIETLVDAAARGVAVRIYLDGTGRPPGARVEAAIDALFSSPQVEVRIKPPQRAIMHLKGYVVDGHVLRTGSANFSASGLKHQDNDMITLTDAHFVRAFEDRFEAMWEREHSPSPIMQALAP